MFNSLVNCDDLITHQILQVTAQLTDGGIVSLKLNVIQALKYYDVTNVAYENNVPLTS